MGVFGSGGSLLLGIGNSVRKKVAPKKTQQKKELHPGGGRDKLELLLCARIWFPSKETKYGCCFLCLPTLPNALKNSKPTYEILTHTISVSF